jgi:drug/metabolite transporter (DMT)-like permease
MCGVLVPLRRPGEIGNVVALSYAPVRLVASMGALTIVFNTLLASKLLDEQLNRRTRVGACVCVTSGIFFVLAADDGTAFTSVEALKAQIQSTPFLLFCFVSLSLTFFAVLSTSLLAVVYCMSVYGMVCVLAVKASVTLFNLIGFADRAVYGNVQWWLAAACVVAIALQCVMFQIALHHHPVSRFVMLHYVGYNAFSCAGSALLYYEFGNTTPAQIVLYCVGMVGASVGVWCIVSRATPTKAYAQVTPASTAGEA